MTNIAKLDNIEPLVADWYDRRAVAICSGMPLASPAVIDPQEFYVASAADRISKQPDVKDRPKHGGKTLALILGATALVAAAAGGGVWFFLSKSGGDHANNSTRSGDVPAPAQYFAMDPAFVVNLNGPVDGPRYLQVEIQLVSRNPDDAKLISDNAPAIRAHLLMLLAGVKSTDIADVAGRQKLQQNALAEARKVMTTETGRPCVQDLLFTSFVTQ